MEQTARIIGLLLFLVYIYRTLVLLPGVIYHLHLRILPIHYLF
jgi:hypothetical protein